MVHNVVATTFSAVERSCYQCSAELGCPVCELLEQNPWKLGSEQLRCLRDRLAVEQMRGPSHATGAGICPHCDLLVSCRACRLDSPLALERVEQLARTLRRSAA